MRCPIWYVFALAPDCEPEEAEELCSHFDCDVCVAAFEEAPWMFGWGDGDDEEGPE